MASTTSAATAARTGPFRRTPRTAARTGRVPTATFAIASIWQRRISCRSGKDERFASGGGALGQIIGGWEIGGLAVLQSGLPLHGHRARIASQHRRRQPRESGHRAWIPMPANQNINLWFDPAAFTTPPAYTWGTLGRNTLNAPALYNFDFSIAKKFLFTEIARTGVPFGVLQRVEPSAIRFAELDGRRRRRGDHHNDTAREPPDPVRVAFKFLNSKGRSEDRPSQTFAIF